LLRYVKDFGGKLHAVIQIISFKFAQGVAHCTDILRGH
jgi:hypothetical protein